MTRFEKYSPSHAVLIIPTRIVMILK